MAPFEANFGLGSWEEVCNKKTKFTYLSLMVA